jgi:hypothetical protein
MAGNGWKLEGSYFEACNCEVACPCVFMSAPTEEECKALVAWNIDKGYFRDVCLDGLNIAIAIHSPGHMMQVKWNVAVYVDERAGAAERDALFTIYSGQAGGHPAAISSFVGAIVGVKSAAFDFRADGRTRSLRIGDLADMAIEAIPGRDGAEVTVTNAPFPVAPGFPSVVARASHLTLRDNGFRWHITDKNGYYSPFSYSAA